MPPYKKPVSEKQRRELWYLAEHGKVSRDDALGESRAVKGEHLPEYAHGKTRPKTRRRSRRRTR